MEPDVNEVKDVLLKAGASKADTEHENFGVFAQAKANQVKQHRNIWDIEK